MSDALWAARVGDALAHTSMLADVLGGVLEVAANVAIGVLATAAVVAATGITLATGGVGACVLGAVVALVVGVVMNRTGADKGLSSICEDIGNGLFPPTVQAHITTGSSDTFINGLPAARAAGSVPSMLVPSGSPEEDTAEPDDQPEPSYLDMAKGFFSQLWRPTVATPGPGVVPRPQDLVLCTRHPPMPQQFLAEGSDKVTINGQPAVRSGDRSTCEAMVVSSGLISPNVRVGGGKVVVRDIRSGKTPGVGLAVTALMMLKGGKGKFSSNLPCMLLGGVNAFVVSSAIGALTQAIAGSPNPVHAATGAKVLGGPEDLDVVLPGMIAIEWQRFYNSRDERRDGLFGAGWSVPYEVCVAIEAHPDGGERLIYIDEQARRIDMGTIPLGGATFSPGEGLAVRRHDNGQLLIENEDGLYRLFEPSLSDPARLRLTQLGDRNDNRIFLEYSADGRLVRLYDTQAAPCLNLLYSAHWPGRVASIERELNDGTHETLARYAFDALGNLAEVRDASDTVQRRFTYDSDGRMVEHQLPTGLRCFYEWALIDAREWRVVHHWTDEGDAYHFVYDLSAGVTQVVDGLNRRSTRRWNSQHQITEYTDSLDRTWRFGWNDERQLLSATDPQGGTWQYSYDESGNLSTAEDPLGRIESTLWLEHWSLPKVETDAAGNPWQFRYDARGNRTHEIDPLGHVTRYRYDGYGRVIEILDATGKTRKLLWNELGQVTNHLDCSGYRTEFNYDPRGRLESIVDTLAEKTSYTYDKQGRLAQRELPDGRTEHYQRDPSGLLTGYVDGEGAISRYHYNRRGQVRQRIDAHNRPVHFHHDAYGRLEALTNENGERYRFAWDNADRLMAQLNLDGTQRRYRYDALDHPVYADQLAPPDGSGGPRDIIVHRLERDAVGRLIAKVTDDGRTEYAYDLLDNLINVTFTDAAGEQNSVGFSYDALGQLLTETSASGTIQHRYDELGHLTQTCTPDGRWINRLLYGSGHLHQINLDGQIVSDFERDRLHREVLRTQGQMNTRSEYDNVGRLRLRTRRLNSQPKHIAAECTEAFEYNRTDNLKVRETRTRQGDLRTLFGYDPSHRITSTQNSQRGQLEQFAYDAAANLMDRQPSGGEYMARNQLLTYQDKRYRYDPFGRLIEKTSLRHGTQHFTYDAESRLIEVRNVKGPLVHMRYDPLGRRIAKRVQHPNGHPMTETRFVWDGLRLLLEETYNRPTLYLYADDGHEPLARVDGQGEHQHIRYYHNALNGLPEQLTDLDGQTLWQARYQVWGNTTEETREPWFVDDQNLRFQGQYLDRETGLHYNTFRFYDPDVGRFTTPDPIGLAGGLNLYQYAPNPIGWVDPWGWTCVRVRHYTNRNGLEGIQASGVIKARDNNRVYLEPAKKKPLSPKEAKIFYGIKDGRGRDYVETDVPIERLEWIKNPAYHRKELTVSGDLIIENATFTKRK